jgi:hypothetical protein
MMLRFALLFLFALSVPAETVVSGRVLKVLPLFLDLKGRTSVSPSLLERDAYQAQLRDKPALRSGLEFAVKWRASGPPETQLTLRLEMRGGRPGQLPTQTTLEQTLTPKGGLFGAWTSVPLIGKEYQRVGEVNSWRATLWHGTRLLAEDKSFLWHAALQPMPVGTTPPAGQGSTPVAVRP